MNWPYTFWKYQVVAWHIRTLITTTLMDLLFSTMIGAASICPSSAISMEGEAKMSEEI